jgi:hypothetical protein
MKKLLNFVLLFLMLALAVEIATAQTSTYILEKDITAEELADKLGIDSEVLRELNADIIKGPSTRLLSGTAVYLPDIDYEFYQEDYRLIIGYSKAWNKEENFSMFYGQAEYLPILELDDDWDLGLAATVKGGGLKLNDGLYNEPGMGWEGFLKTRIRQPGGSFYDFWFSYGQNNLFAELATGLQQRLFSHYWALGAEFHPFSNRFLNQSPWFNDASLYAEVRFPLKQDKLFWDKKPVNPELLSDEWKIKGEVTVFDWSLSDEIMLPMGLVGSASVYDFPGKKSFWAAGVFVEPVLNKRPIGRIGFRYESGVSNISFNRFVINFEFDFGTFLDRNEPKFNNQ